MADWFDQIRRVHPLVLTPGTEETMRSQAPWTAGFAEGHLFVCEHAGRLVSGCVEPAHEHASEALRVIGTVRARTGKPVTLVPYAVLASLPPGERVADFVARGKFESCGAPVWIDLFLAVLPDRLALFKDVTEHIQDRRCVELDGLVLAPSAAEAAGLARQADGVDGSIRCALAEQEGVRRSPKMRLVEVLAREWGLQEFFGFLPSEVFGRRTVHRVD